MNDDELKGRGATRRAHTVSVVIVTYESADDIVECLRSVRKCALPLEVIVIDNASTDASVQRMRMHPALADSLTCNADNVGFAKAVNQGIQRARGEYVLLLNPDSVLQANAIELAVDALNMHSDAAVAGCLLLNPDLTEQPGGRRSVPTPARALVRMLGLHRIFPGRQWARGFVLSDDPLPGQTVDVEATSGAFMLVRRAAIDQIGALDEGYFMHCEDLDWCMRFRAGGWRVLFVPAARVLHKKGRSGRHRPIRVEWHKHKGMIRFYRKFFLSQYPVLLMPVIAAGVWVRFAIKAATLVAVRLRPALPRGSGEVDAVSQRRTVQGRAAVGRFESRRS